MKLITAIALFEAGYIFKERNVKFTSGYRPYKPDYSKTAVPKFVELFKKKREARKIQFSIQDIKFDTKDDACKVLDRMNREIYRYGYCRVADFYNFSGISHKFNLKLFETGWTDLTNAKPIMEVNGRWIIDFPEPVDIER